jgi:hypothetical protein
MTNLNLRQKPIYVLCFLFILAVPQVLGLAGQFQYGFRPFFQDPIRIPFSWDMFSNRVDRCIVTWTHPLRIQNMTFSSLREVNLPLEWDVVLDRIEDYQYLASALCPFATTFPAYAQLDCFAAEGNEVIREVPCQ